MASTLNIRIDSALKERGDKVLKENGISVTEAIRALWETLAKTHELPEFLQNQDPKKEEVMRKKLDAIELLGALPATRFSNTSDDELRDMQYEEKLREYEALA
ncbi:MAG TPA: type II toxin-antitoxin system RelB/DinJ family antitoxin [Coriobacteriaceae bacterium]|nr:type II toxin-antitoxin system RelB/DinJ family antitoxin [Coriobacteriaceae bacterium]